MIKSNFHTHTVFCDGSNTAEEMVQQALSLGFDTLGFSGHMDFDIHMELDRYVAEIRRLQDKYRGQLDILLGIELDNLYDPSCKKEAEYVIGSTHFLDVASEKPMAVDADKETVEILCREYFGGDPYAMTKSYFELTAKVADRTGCDFIGHYDLITRFNDELQLFDEEDPRYLTPALEVMEYLVKRDIPFEINCGAVNRKRKKELYPNSRLLKALHDFGGKILINSDAHQKELLNGGFDVAVERAKACGFTEVLTLGHNDKGKVVWKEEKL